MAGKRKHTEPGSPEKALKKQFRSVNNDENKVNNVKFNYHNHIQAVNTAFSKALPTVLPTTLDPDQRVHIALLQRHIEEYLHYTHQIASKYPYYENTGLYTFGSGDCGQLGHGVEEDADNSEALPRELNGLKNIVHVACGGLHTLALNSSGQVYSWGCNDEFTLGRDTKEGEGSSTSENFPALVPGLHEKVTAIAGGDTHSIVLTEKGEVYVWGCYRDNGGKKWCESHSAETCYMNTNKRPFKINIGSKVKSIACGNSFNLALTEDNRLYSWGFNESGELGRPVQKLEAGKNDIARVFKEYLTPHEVKIQGTIKTIGCGAFHSFVSVDTNNETGIVFGTGLNQYGQLGLGDDKNRSEFTRIPGLRDIIMFAGGEHHTLALSIAGDVYSFGRKDSGQCGIDSKQPKTGDFSKKPLKIKSLNARIRSIVCGSHYNLAWSYEDEIFGWGYGEMGALGTGEAKDAYVPQKVNLKHLKEEYRIIDVAAGGQHSAILMEKCISP